MNIKNITNMGTITVNGVTYKGNNLHISNNKVIIDGKQVNDSNELVISISVVGDINTLEVDNADKITIKGNVGTVESTNGDIDIEGTVNQYVKSTNGDITATTILGGAKSTNGDVKFKNQTINF